MQYNENVWANDTTPEINADHLNNMELGIKISTEAADAFEPITDVKWQLNRYIGSDGSMGQNNYRAITNAIPCKGGDVVVKLTPKKDSQNNDLLFYVAQWSGSTFISRTRLWPVGESIVLDDNCDSFRIDYGRSESTGVVITQADVNTYFKWNYYKKCASEIDFEKVVNYSLPKFNFSWLIGKNVDAAGNVVTGVTYGCTTPILVYGGMVECSVPNRDINGIELYIRVAEYKNGIFQRRTNLVNGMFNLLSDTTEIRFGLGRAAGSGVNFSQSDIDNYFTNNISLYSEALSKGEYINDKQNGTVANLLHLAYSSSSGADSSTEQLSISVPINEDNKEVFLMGHCVDNSVNADVWRIIYAYKNDTQITRRGEWECALHLDGRDDFSGGIVHGDEIDQQVNFFADGVKTAVASLDGVSCSELKIVRNSKMYDPADHTTVICEHGVEYTFNVNGLKIKQTVKWKVAEALTNCYLAMLPIMKAYSQYRYDDTSFDVKENNQTHYNVNIPGAKSVSEYSATNKTFFSMSINKYPTGLTGGDKASVTDNGGIDYNKIYFVVCSSGNSTVDELWCSETNYQFK